MEPNLAAQKEANRLYWQTDRSVADIAETLGVSRRALYELITPAPAGVDCGACGGEVVYSNRSAQAARAGRCSVCALETEVAAREEVMENDEAITPYAAGWPRVVQRTPREPEVRERAFRLGSAAIAGVAVGAIAAFLITRRR